MIVYGLVLVVAGAVLASVPLGALRAASHLRWTGMPPHPSAGQVRQWRLAGLLMVVAGTALVALGT